MKRALLVLLAAACAPKRTEVSSDDMTAVQNAMAQARAMQDAVDRTNRECHALDGRPVPASEERVFGERAALAWGLTGSGFWLDEAGTKGDRWAVNQYVQVVGLLLAHHSQKKDGPWTFGVVDAPAPFAVSEMGGYVFVSTALLAKLENEAQLAAALAHEIVHVANGDRLRAYAKARATACNIALQGYYLVEAGSAQVAGGQEYVSNAKFGKTMRHFATTDPLDVETDPEIDHEFVRWYLSRISESQRIIGTDAAEEEAADQAALKLLAAAGYDTGDFAKVIDLVDTTSNAAPRKAKLGKSKPGKAPALPKLKWP